ncbi:acyl-CoA dehydrogenase family protein [Mycobacterium sp.]|uniref:acyl-CoA dehydrogenase family protein n=1 Tax=Mycobacterium sp. TaxID=1785 RepID=UPI003BB15430
MTSLAAPGAQLSAADLADGAREFLVTHDPATTDPVQFLRARFDAGLARVSYPVGLGGLEADPGLQDGVDAIFAAAGSPGNRARDNIVGHGMAGPTILQFGTPEQRSRWMRPLWTGEEVWCQLFSEPGAGSDLAGLATSAVRDGDDWVVNGQKVWNSMAHEARWGILVARTDPAVPKHRGLTYFICDMSAPGVEVRPLRQITGETEFNEVFLDDVRIPDAHRLGAVGQGWAVTQGTLMNERVTIGAAAPRGGGAIGELLRAWREHPQRRTAGLQDRMMQLWVEAEAARLASVRMRQTTTTGQPGPEGSAGKLSQARLNQQISSLELDLRGEAALRYGDYTERRPVLVDLSESTPGYRYLRARANSIEGGSSEIMRNIIAERMLGLPPEPRTDKDLPWKELAR